VTQINTPDAVPNELITAAWGDTVRGDLQRLNSTKVERTGDSMSGMLILPGTNPTNANHAARKGYVDAQVSTSVRTGVTATQTLAGALSAPNLLVTASPPSTNANAVVPRQEMNALLANRVSRNGDTMQGVLTLDSSVGDPTGTNAYTRRSWQVATFQQKSGCDYRLKERLGSIGDAAQRVQELAGQAYRGRWLADNDREWDFLDAHDIAAVADYAVQGEPNAVDAQGNPVYQTVRLDHLVPLLVAALGDALHRIAQLEAGAA
jgi:hypothetical protein